MTSRCFACAALMAMSVSSLFASRAQADEMDLALERLVLGGDGACQETLQDPPILQGPDGAQTLKVDNAAWGALMAVMAGATLPSLLQPVTTSGPKGVDVMLAQSFTGLSSGAEYWKKGSRGRGKGSQRDCSGVNRSVDRLLTRSQLRLIKSLPYGISFGSTLGKVWNTDLWTFGGELKIALVEGYRRLAVPDIAIRAAANTVVGDGQYALTNLAASVILSKPLVAARTMRITPYVAYQAGVSFASSTLIDLTPHTDAFARCDSPPPNTNDQLNCASGRSDDLGHDQPFDNLVILRHQFALGLVLHYKFFTLTSEFLLDLVPVSQSDSDVSGVPRQWSVGVSPGVSF